MYTKINEELLFERLHNLKYSTLLKNALEKSHGSKTLINGAWFIYIIIAIAINALLSLAPIKESIASLIAMPLILPIGVGVLILGVQRVREQDIEVSSIFNNYIYVWQLFFAYILVSLFTAIGIVFLVIPGIYLMVAYMFAQILVVDKGLSFWDAMELSRKVVSKRWFFFFGYFAILTLLFVASWFTLGIALIWLVPVYTISYAMLYDFLFSTLQDEDN